MLPVILGACDGAAAAVVAAGDSSEAKICWQGLKPVCPQAMVARQPIFGKSESVTPADMLVVALLAVLGFVLGVGLGMFFLARRQVRAKRLALAPEIQELKGAKSFTRFTVEPYHPVQARRPARWLAIRTRDLHAVQLALGLRDPRPCSWSEGLFSSRQWFIAPPINGWTLVFGADLPIPDDDVDVCYRFLRTLSQKLGQVQFFQADSVLQHHAWARLESGRVVRAYAWAGTTLWNQGVKTSVETALGLNCFNYGENPGSDDWAVADHIVANVEKVSQLAQRWSIDPAEIDGRMLAQQQGIAGNTAQS